MKHNLQGKVRVVAGSAGGLWIHVPANFPSRPTQDRVKQAIFSSLGNAVVEAHVLDLFAGSGALGIEALSRGSASATFVDESRLCTATISDNLVHCSFKGTVFSQSVEIFLARSPQEPLFALVFADPPYVKGDCALHQQKWLALLAPHVASGGRLVFEHHFKNVWKEHPDWTLLRQSKYGDTTVTNLRRTASV